MSLFNFQRNEEERNKEAEAAAKKELNGFIIIAGFVACQSSFSSKDSRDPPRERDKEQQTFTSQRRYRHVLRAQLSRLTSRYYL